MNPKNPLWLWKNWPMVRGPIAAAASLPLIITSIIAPLSFFATLSAFLAVAALGYVIYYMNSFDNITAQFAKECDSDPMMKLAIEGNLKKIKALGRSAAELQLEHPSGQTALGWAVINGHDDVVEYLLSNGVSPDIPFWKENDYPIFLAARAGHKDIYKVLKDKVKKLSFAMEEEQVTQFMLDCYEGNLSVVEKQEKEYLCQQKDKYGLTALHYALLGAKNPRIVLHLLKLNANVNAEAELISASRGLDGYIHYDIETPVLMAFSSMPAEVVFEMVKKEKTFPANSQNTTVLMLAAKHGMKEILLYLKDLVDFELQDDSGKDALAYARANKHLECEKILREWIEEKRLGHKQPSHMVSAATVSQPSVSQEEKIKLDLMTTLRGLVGMESFIDNFTHEVKTFSEQKGKSRGIVLWGNSSVGKTEIGKRLSGLKENIVKFSLPGIKFKYIACCDQTIDVKKIIEETENKTVLFLDEIDKYLSPSSGLVSESQAKGLKTSLVTNFESKEIFWVFTGTFADIREGAKLTRTNLDRTLGQELASRLDFSDWMMNDWTIQTLLLAAQSSLQKDKHIDYDDEALQKLVAYVLKHNAGVRGLEKAHDSIKRSNRNQITDGMPFLVTGSLVEDYIRKET